MAHERKLAHLLSNWSGVLFISGPLLMTYAMNTKREVYLDYSASTPVDPRVIKAMMPYFSEVYGNSTSSHRQGRLGDMAIEEARANVAQILNCQPSEVIFTSCGSESDNLAIRGAAWLARQQGKPARLITTPVEHSAVINTVLQLGELMDAEPVIVPVDRHGLVHSERFADACRRGAALASIIYANNEVGSVNDLAELAAIAREHDGLVPYRRGAGRRAVDARCRAARHRYVESFGA